MLRQRQQGRFGLTAFPEVPHSRPRDPVIQSRLFYFYLYSIPLRQASNNIISIIRPNQRVERRMPFDAI